MVSTAKKFYVTIVLEQGVCSTTDDVASQLRRVANRVSEGEWSRRMDDTDASQIAAWGVRG